ncbi:fibronectin type III domain-containing protein 5b isoform X3 [Eucyclogobius newberryi]|uniref:fibronectin type III domain-containing protein 5b isoform X3 n=1 Tax=Eucyclogobius newberryi TaxID=166745 RepID=UPI003B5CDE61
MPSLRDAPSPQRHLDHCAPAEKRPHPPERVDGTARSASMDRIFRLLVLSSLGVPPVSADSLSPPVNVTIREVRARFAVVTWDIPEGDNVIGFAITQQKKDVRMLRFIQEVNTTTRSCALWDLEEETDYIVHVQSISMSGMSPHSEPLRFRTPKDTDTQVSKNKDEVTMEEVGQATQLRAGELIIIVVVLIMWAGVIALFCRQYDIIKDNEPNNNKDKAKNSSECSTPEHPTGGLLRSKV